MRVFVAAGRVLSAMEIFHGASIEIRVARLACVSARRVLLHNGLGLRVISIERNGAERGRVRDVVRHCPIARAIKKIEDCVLLSRSQSQRYQIPTL